jgi:hypothetical protein
VVKFLKMLPCSVLVLSSKNDNCMISEDVVCLDHSPIRKTVTDKVDHKVMLTANQHVSL